MTDLPISRAPGLRSTLALVATPAVIVFLSSNFVNAGNLAFNMIFSRLMGPELFGVLAMILTIKLALLGVMGAIQMAVSQLVASCTGDERPTVEQALSRINRFLFLGVLILGIALTTSLVLGGSVGARLLPTEPHLLAILLAAMPFGAAFSVLRGIAFGDMMTGRIVWSANIEMGVRLIGALLAWALGFGIEGVVVAISVSIVAGWLVLADLTPKFSGSVDIRPFAKTLTLAAIPFGLLQVTQVIALDGDIFLAKAFLSDEDAGFIAALSLFQRIQFFACFALSSVLLPKVIRVVQQGGNVLECAMPVYALFAVVSLIVILGAVMAPETMISLLAGTAYVPAASSLALAVVAASLFTFSYLTTTLLIACNDKVGVVLISLGAVLQGSAMGLDDPARFGDLIEVKAICQLIIALLILLRAAQCLRGLKSQPNA